MSAQQLITDHLDLWTGAVTHKSGSGRSASGKNGKIELTGIKKLRELILELAVRGKLVEQDPSDEPASVLLERIAEEKTRLVKEGKIKKPKKLPHVSEKDKYFQTPKKWEWVRLGNLFNSIMSGGTPNKSNPEFWGGKIPWASVKDLGKSKNIEKTIDYITAEGLKAGSKLADSGDILICTRMGLGKVAICSRPVAINQDIKAVKLSSGTSIDFFLIAYKALDIIGTGTTVSGITQDKLLNYIIGLPPLEEQHRIVKKVDELMALCDQLEQEVSDQLKAHEVLVDTLLDALTRSADAAELTENWGRVAEHFDTLFTTEASIDKLKKTILQLAVMGRLVEQDPNDEPASVLLEKMAEEKTKLVGEGKIKKLRRLSTPPIDEVPFELPHNWQWCRLPDIGELARGKSKHRPRNDPSLYQGGTTPLVQTGDVARADRKITTHTAQYNEIGVAQSKLWPAGTLCITIAANIGDTGILEFEACFPDSVVGFTPFSPGLKNEYFEYFLRTAKRYLEEFAPSTAQKNINLDVLQHILVPLPPTNELHKIVNKLDKLMALCDQLKVRLGEADETRAQLAETVVEQTVS